MYQPPKTTPLSPRPWIIGWLAQIGWMNACIGALCLLAAVAGTFGAMQQGTSEKVQSGFAFAWSAASHGWLWVSLSVVAYGIAHICVKLHELKIWMDAQK